MTKYVFLDYDGFICKAWFASQARGHHDDPELILTKLVMSAVEKAENYFNHPVVIFPFVSGHSYKKDLYDTYKEHREKDGGLGEFRDYIISEYKVIRSEQLEADDLISLCAHYLERIGEGNNYIVFSDDKDLHYISRVYCKINIQSKVQTNSLPVCSSRKLMCQLIAGDKEDDIDGIPKVGMKTADKVLPTPCNLADVFKLYKSKGCSIDYALKNVSLVMPLLIHEAHPDFLCAYYVASTILEGDRNTKPDEEIIAETIKVQLEFLEKIAKGVYNEQ